MPRRGTEKSKTSYFWITVSSTGASRVYILLLFLVCFLLWSMRDGLGREDTGSVDTGFVVQGLSSKCKNHLFSNARFCTNIRDSGLCSCAFRLLPLQSEQFAVHSDTEQCLWVCWPQSTGPGHLKCPELQSTPMPCCQYMSTGDVWQVITSVLQN